MKRKILVITESKAIRFLLQTVLNDQFNTITAAEAGDAMYWISQSELPDAIVIDPNLPDTEPWELVEHLKTSFLYKHIPLIVISAQPEEELISLSANYNVDAFFHKPFNPIDLKKKLELLTKLPASSNLKLLKVV
ncbi:response regulator [Flavihumibacter fluvii]|uniref:response regulator n=1 Tax=Flavihumibacter fluvii TaxID=2838157 RepID=UPI001BDE8096|nr:response regulator [Flavihumibacter fluvii]ULQ50686.1 response regulator [Flavihumibacter fluvii]